MSVVIVLWCAFAVAGAPDYDAFSQADGFIAQHQELAAWKMMRDPDQLEAVYADAAKGNERATRVVRQLEVTLSAGGRDIAERVNRPGCLVPGAQQLVKTCRPDWSFLDFLSKERPCGVRLRTAIFTAFATRAHELGLENQAILSVAMAGSVLARANTPVGEGTKAGLESLIGRDAVASVDSAPRVPGSLIASGSARRVTIGFIDDVTVVSRGKVIGRGTVDVRATIEGIRSGRLSPRDIYRNDQGLLPKQGLGYYQEFVHPTPGVSGAGPQRIIRGQGGELYYTPDHYETFIPLN